jgi:hypothetical protein
VDGIVQLANGTGEAGEIRKAFVTGAAEHDLVADLADENGVLPEPPPGAKRVKKKEPLRLRTFA